MTLAPPHPKQAPARIARHLQHITHQHFFRTFEDWLALAVNAFLRDDNAYMDIMRRYGPREAPMPHLPGGKDHPADHFARALGEWMGAMQAQPADYLGQIYEEQAVANHYQGQFFTPEPLTELMAAMTMPDPLPDDAVVHDPACVPIPAISISRSNALRSCVPGERDQWRGVCDGSIGLIG